MEDEGAVNLARMKEAGHEIVVAKMWTSLNWKLKKGPKYAWAPNSQADQS